MHERIFALSNLHRATVIDHILERLLLIFCRSPEAVSLELGDSESTEGEQDALALLERVYPEFRERIRGLRVLDFGCGTGHQTAAFAEIGAAEVVGVDINSEWRRRASALATQRGIADRVRFVSRISAEDAGRFDFVFSQNSMEHFPNPEQALREMANALAPNGRLLVTFGLPWYAPYGAHMHYFTKIPWVHLIFPERVIMRVRSRYKADGARSYVDVEGGLNKMSLKKFKQLLHDSGLRVEKFATEPVKGQQWLARLPGLSEFFTNHVTAVLFPAVTEGYSGATTRALDETKLAPAVSRRY
ncbi:MAG: class I SAM-dependent methyltransferase [Gemmatimonadota bacterium]|nr:class I SAM-dependent methyltransferase [Gemmatimonadota bacterium]